VVRDPCSDIKHKEAGGAASTPSPRSSEPGTRNSLPPYRHNPILIGLHWPTALVFALVWLGVAAVSRYSSLSALTASLAAPISLFFFGFRAAALVMLVLAILLWWKHSANIQRLLYGSEGKIGSKA
jgi:hypothetical protein